MSNDLSGKLVASEVGERDFGHENPISGHFEQAVKATPPCRYTSLGGKRRDRQCVPLS